jgi:hypothetical protein
MMTTSEKATQKSITLPLLSVHHTSFFLWALCQEPVRSTTHRLVAASGAGLPFLEISALRARSCSRWQLSWLGTCTAFSLIKILYRVGVIGYLDSMTGRYVFVLEDKEPERELIISNSLAVHPAFSKYLQLVTQSYPSAANCNYLVWRRG